MVNLASIISEFEHECSLAGGAAKVRRVGGGVFATCDLPAGEVQLEVPPRGSEYSLSFVLVSDSRDNISRVFSALRGLWEEE